MRKVMWMSLMLFLIVPGLLFTVSCAKKTVKSAETTQPVQEDQAVIQAREAEKQKAEEAARQAAIEQERLAREKAEQQRLMEQQLREEAQRREIASAMQQFENENIYFDFDSSALDENAQRVLMQKAQWLRDNPNKAVTIQGHCDERGTNEYNLALGERRAESAKMFLVDLGIPASRLNTISYGEERPLDPGHNEEAWAKNRRDQFVIE